MIGPLRDPAARGFGGPPPAPVVGRSFEEMVWHHAAATGDYLDEWRRAHGLFAGWQPCVAAAEPAEADEATS